jgi:hypothetical protein
MAYFQTQNPNLGKFYRVLRWKMLVYFTAFWFILLPFGIHILWLFGIFSSFWNVETRQILPPCSH